MATLSAGDVFKNVVQFLLYMERYPSPKAIQETLGRPITHDLNGKECKWRDEVWVPWMAAHPDHWITEKRNKVRIWTAAELTQMHNEDAIAGLLEIEADLR